MYPYFWEALRNSSIWALLGVFVQIPIATLIALALSRKVRGIKFVRNAYIIPNMISTAAMGMIFLQLYSPLYGIVNPIIKLFQPGFKENISSVKRTGIYCNDLCLYLLYRDDNLNDSRKYMAIPEDVKEAAMLDGASGTSSGLVYYASYDQRNSSYGIYSVSYIRLPALQ